jgi:hypothetical protein
MGDQITLPISQRPAHGHFRASFFIIGIPFFNVGKRGVFQQDLQNTNADQGNEILLFCQTHVHCVLSMILHCRSHARITWVDFPGAWYHVLNRETERRAIFRSTRCYEQFFELPSSLPERLGVRLHGYALMGNHYHLQLESREANLSKALHCLNVSYSGWFNRKYSRVGPLFQGLSKPSSTSQQKR